MKTLLIIFSLFGLVALSGCAQKTDTNVLLQNSETRNEIFDVIVEDRDMMNSFMEKMQDNENAMHMMQGNQMMIGHMMDHNGIQMMIKNGPIMNNMMQLMHENGMLSNECMQDILKTMNDKGMKMNGMGMMNQEEDNNK
ncbi:hypothetical protein DHD32_16075 [Arenibacter sp. TNZ]|uniref:hypothetical protein n=1 Tax=Arenibacter TaxID=178469 RepID=UPI000CD48DCC|nr:MULTISPECIES: hypothetical protein [Arenibacter]MCM4173006.1 hypothetical protein [Arenibacter sp. TNZ]